ncbi:MAG: OmpA family protein [Pseudomonadota bacterium]|nr:OmpA family protein [Pseudomonadota bacterium]
MILALTAAAFAGDTFDAHGFHLVAFTDDPSGALQLSLPTKLNPGSFYLGVLGEYAEAPLVRVNADGSVDEMLDGVVALNLSGGWAPLSRLRLDVSAPVFVTSTGPNGPNGFAMGDVRLAANVVILDGTFGLGVVPFVDLPSGRDDAWLGQSTVSGGGLVAARVGAGKVHVGASVGTWFQPDVALENLTGADRLLLGAQAGVRITDSLAVNTELRSEVPFAPNAVAGTETPTEILLYGRNRFDNGAHALLGGAVAVSPGASAAFFRVFIGGGFGATAKKPPVDTDGDGFFDPVDGCPAEAETVNTFKDTDGCPDRLGELAIDVYHKGKPVDGAALKVAGSRPLEGRSVLDPILHGELMPGDVYVGSAELGCLAGKAEATVPEGRAPLRIELVPDLSAVVRVEVYDAQDKPLPNAVVTWERETTGCVSIEPTRFKDTHTGRVSAGIGSHTLFVTVDGYNIHAESVALEKGDDKLVVVKLAPTKVRVTREKIEILDKVYFEFDGDKIDPRSGALLDEVANTLRNHPEVLLVEVGGHTDSKGNDKYNVDLSQRRVNSVRSYLVGKGVPEGRLVAKGYGETKPIANNKTAAGRAENRRVEFNILQNAEGAAEEVKTIDSATQQDKDKAGVKEENRPDASKIDKD